MSILCCGKFNFSKLIWKIYQHLLYDNFCLFRDDHQKHHCDILRCYGGGMGQPVWCTYEMHSDQGRNFESAVFREMCSILNIEKQELLILNQMEWLRSLTELWKNF